MTILAIRTDKLEAELYLYQNDKLLGEISWQAHMKLAETLNAQIKKILNKSSKSYNDLAGIVIYKGPGSFTGLRIGMSVANALAYAKEIPIVAKAGEGWLQAGIKALVSDQNHKVATPEYGTNPHVTKPRK